MSKLSLFAAVFATAVAASPSAFATEYGSAASVAYSLGATASPGIAGGGRNAPAITQPVEQPLVAGSASQRERVWSQLRHR